MSAGNATEQVVRVVYRDHEGTVRVGRVLPTARLGHFRFGATRQIKDKQWLLEVSDLDTKKTLTLAMKDILAWGDEAVEQFEATWKAQKGETT